jgi:hypothetical protein
MIERKMYMLSAKETKRLLKEFAWECYEFWSNELETDDDAKVWPKVLMDLECATHDPFSPKGEKLDAEAKTELIKQLKSDLGI